MSVNGLLARASPRRAPPPVTTLRMPLGRSSPAAILANSMTVTGATLLGLTTTAHPASRDGATLRAVTKSGKFQGQMPATTPMGWR